LPADDFRRRFPRFHGEAFYHNLDLVKEIEVIAKRKGVTPAQVGLGWIRTLSGKNGLPVLIPIPGASSDGRVRENSANITLTSDEMAEIQSILNEFAPKGGRYGSHAHVNG
jgi:pyridoxine 4-dehydrogenase